MKRRYLVALAAGLAVAGAAAMLIRTGPRAANTMVIGLSADVATFEPANISSRDNMNIAHHIFASLFTLDADGKHVPNLAREMAISDDGLAYTYTLRDGLTCHDGEALTAEDVAYTFTRIADQPTSSPATLRASSSPRSASAVPRRSTRSACASRSPARTPSPSAC